MKHAVCEAVAAEAPDVGCGDTTHVPVSWEAARREEAATRGQMGVLLTAVAAPSSPSCSGGGNIG